MDTIIVLDCGGQYAHLIANRIRRLNVYSEIRTNDVKAHELKGAKGIIISGGPECVLEPDSPTIDPGVFDLGIPVLGICYGHQLMAHILGGRIEAGQGKEYGLTEIIETEKDRPKIFEDLQEKETVYMNHGDEVSEAPEGFKLYFKTAKIKNAAMVNEDKKFYSVQFHPEVTHTPCGMKIFDQFLNICEVKREWDINSFLVEEMRKIKEQVGDKKVFLLTSGGVDSTVAFLLLSKSLGKDNVYGLFVDTGLMRKEEEKEIEQNMKVELGFDNLHIAHKAEAYYEALKDKYEPEEKRKIIGDLFLDISDEVSKELNLNPDEWLLGQGTIYPDTIESGGTKHASKIKTHHNRVEQIEKLIEQGLMVEPLKELYKDEVRELGVRMGLHEDMVWRHPFPGPGLGVRMLCVKEPDVLENASDLESKIQEEWALESRVLSVKSVGVQGDARSYRHPLAVFHDIESKSWEEWEKIATSVANTHHDVNRVILCASQSRIPETLEVLPRYITGERVEVLQEVDAIVMKIIKKSGWLRDIWQFPVVLLPVSLDGKKESIILRPVNSEEAMTANFTKLSLNIVKEIVDQVMGSGLVSGVFYDITNKPPGTIEWE